MNLNRKQFLQAGSVMMSLPYLEALGNQKKKEIPRRMGIFYYGTGMNMNEFEPKEDSVGSDYEMSPTLKVLKPHKKDFTFLRGTYLNYGGGHQGDYTFATGAPGTTSSGIVNSISMDQVAANQIGSQTRYSSIQLGERSGTGYGGDLETLSWSENAVPLAAECDPYIIFNRLFKATSKDENTSLDSEFQKQGSVLDLVFKRANNMKKSVSKSDSQKLDEYFTSVREVEKQLQRSIAWSKKPKPKLTAADYKQFSASYKPGSPGFSYNKYAKMMFDLLALAWSSDSTRVASYMVRRESSGKTWDDLKASTSFHGLTHHGNEPKKLAELARVDRIYMTHWNYFMTKLKSIKEVDGNSLLDHTMLAFSSSMGIGHSKDRLPTVLCGGKALGIKHQGHLAMKKNTPLSRLWETMLHGMQVNVPEKFQDSTGKIDELLS
ncbi:MAG: DUF1552 domain-containing protein [Lentisphaerales bacterium]|nr:DUF1552 domain-containing protein [Lentisphaerales bacterium]